jgi:hypothetical protein
MDDTATATTGTWQPHTAAIRSRRA